MWYASSCSGMRHHDRRQQRRRRAAARRSRVAASDRASSPACRRRRVVSAITEPPRAFTSCMLPIIFSNTWSCGAIATTGMLLVDERDRAVLHLAGRIALGVDVRDLLQLQRAFERDRVVDAAAEVEEVGAVVEARRRSLRSPARASASARAAAAAAAARRCAARDASGDSVPRTWPRCSAEQVQRDELRRERLGRGDADLRAGVRVDRAVGLARRHAADDVADGDAARARRASPRAAPPACRRSRPTA